MAVPSAVAAQFPEAAGLPTPLGCVGLDLLLFSADPAAVHDAFLAAAAVGSPSRAGSLRLLLSAPLHRSSSASDPHPDDEQDSSKAAASAAHAAADLATSQTGPGAESEELAASLSDRLTFDVCETLVPDLPEEAFHVIVCSNFHTSQQAELETMLAALYASLRQGGELFVSVLLVNRRLGPGVTPEQLEAAGVGCCHYAGDFIDAMRAVGFLQPRVMRVEAWDTHGADDEQLVLLAGSKLSICTIRAQKNRLLDKACEDYGMWVAYKGSVDGCPDTYIFDMNHKFVKNEPMLVCGNTAAMLGEKNVSWLSGHFVVLGDRGVHYGSFTAKDKGGSEGPCCLGVAPSVC